MPSEPQDVSVSQALELITGEAILLDVREQHEWDAGHAPQAQHLAMSELSGRIEELPKDKQIVCVCHLGGRSAAVSAALLRAGWNAVNLTGGMRAWAAEGHPVIDAAGQPGEVD